MKRFQFIKDWRNWWRFWSIRLGAIGATLTTYLIASPDAALYAWSILPQELKDAIPPQYTPLIGVAIFVLSMLARVIKQTKLEGPKE